MTEDLRIISEGLVFDLISKSFRALHLGDVGGWGITSRAAHLELRVLEKLWAELSLCLRDIEMEPVTHLRLIRERCRYRGTERLNQSGIRELAMAGIHPKWNRVSRPLSVIRERLEETTATPEHRIVAGFLRFLRARIEDCRNRAEKSIEAIEAYRPVRDIQLSAGRTLYESHDVPRIHVLERACGRARHLESRIAEAQRLPFLPAAEPSLEVSLTPVFDHVRPYYRLRNIMLSYLRSSLVVLDAGLEERVKSTHRMYEQWVFLQIAASLRAGGLRCESYAGLLRQTGVYRFTFDLERNTTIVYKAADGRIVRLRYEPFVFPEQDAIARGETLYRGTRGDTPWCPDLLIEFCPRQKNPTDPLRPEYVVVLDAKYSKSIADRHWLAVDKYRQIRATHDRSAVVKQLWIAFPSEDDPVCRDPAVEWLSTGPNRPMTELVEGVIGMQPPSVAPTSPSDEGEILGHVQSAAFVSGLLTYLGIGKDQIESAVA
jgi:hypothetical protein